jgi:hypothetical protein
MKKNETDKKCREIMEAIVEIANREGLVAFEEDFGGNTLTILVGQKEKSRHTHVGNPDSSFVELVDSLHKTLIGKNGLTWC